MANPAPTINQINAFNATQGTTIDFNIIGGTELVRSNRIYIYDLSDNSLICTHLYVSTESIHELPPNTDGSIVYESGKSSADFVNGAQYYAQIQTFTDIAGTQGGSGLSVAKMFWCLDDPTLTITTIPSTISTTSYNVSATYTDTSASVVSNIIQQYQFNLYSATGSLLQSSGVVVGSGEQQGTSTTYDISYNFTGLSVGSSYYVVVDVTTTQGMSVSAQSGTFTVSIDTPTLGEATVVNNACDGYISVISNLSSEYGGGASGEIASFVTNSINNVSSLKVSLEPIQDLNGYDKPWAAGAGENLINSDILINDTYNKYNIPNPLKNGQTYTYSVYGDNTFGYGLFAGHTNTAVPQPNIPVVNRYVFAGNHVTFTAPDDIEEWEYLFLGGSANGAGGKEIQVQIEKGTVANPTYHPYTNICPISGHTEVVTQRTGKNLLNLDRTLGTPNPSAGTNTTSPRIMDTEHYYVGLRHDNYYYPSNVAEYSVANNEVTVRGANNAYGVGFPIEVKPNTQYKVSATVVGSGYLGITYYDTEWNYISFVNDASAFTTPSNASYAVILLRSLSTSATATWKNVQVELGTTATTYEPYNGHTYTTDLPQTVYGGTLDVVTGELVVDRAYASMDGATQYLQTGDYTLYRKPNNPFSTNVSGGNALSNITNNFGNIATGLQDTKIQFTTGGAGYIYASIPNGVNINTVTVVYTLATPQTYQLTPHQIQTLVGTNNVWSEQGDVEVTYNIPITNLLVKRQDVADVSGTWLTLHSQPITQASDMDFTFIDFLNQYGKTYKYALVPLLTQTQSGVEVEVEGGYTVSDEVQSIFDGVFIADSTGSQKCKANVGYGNVDMNQTVGTITPIGAQYPVVITNSKNQYHNGSISGTIVPDDYYFNGNLSRIDMVNKRNELEQFLTNKRAKIIKDWNGNIWLAMIMDNVSCTFNNNYGMGIVNFSTNWIEVGDPTNQQDLQATGLIDVGGA